MTSKQYRKFNANVRQEIHQHTLAMFDKKVQVLRDERPWMTEHFHYGHQQPTKAAREMGDAVYKELYPTAVRARMTKLPKGWLPEVLSVRVHVKSQRNEGHDSVPIFFTEPRRIHSAHHDERSLPTIDGPKSRVLAEDRKLIEQWQQERLKLQSKTWELLQQIRTAEQLFERWPEALQIMPEGYFRPEPPSTALVIQSSELNKILGL